MRHSSAIDFPAHVHLETMAQCNAACNFCPYPSLERKGTVMDDALIAKVVNDLSDIPRLHTFQLSPFKVNEPFLDKRLFDLMELFTARLPNAKLTLTSNASPITVDKLRRLAGFHNLDYLWISFNDHREAEYEVAMQLPYRRTVERLQMIHKSKADGWLPLRVVLSRVGDGTEVDREFLQWVGKNFPLFNASVFPRGEWLGQVSTAVTNTSPEIGCIRWFDISITATGVVAHCCMDGAASYPIGNVRFEHVLEIYNKPDFRRLRAATTKRQEVDPCRSCSFT
jgi:radical SAM protein with 4Fe4S-binding SPASM domain